MLAELVEVGFDLTSAGGPFLVLDDPIAGQLDNPDWGLGGTQFVDITSYVRSIEITRGKADFLGTISAGEAVVELNNRSRAFDPTFEASPFYGNIVPKREVRISTNGIVQYRGVIDDWNLIYTTNGDAVAVFVASDGFVFLSNQTLGASTSTVQSSGDRVNAILDDPFVQWPATQRNIDTGVSVLGADVIAVDTNVLQYLQKVEQSELGRFFIAKNGYATFLDRTVAPTTAGAIQLADDGTGIPYQDLSVMYGSENLANEIVASSVVTAGTVTVTDADSQAAYGIFNLTLTDLLLSTDTQVADIAVFLASKYSQPKYRFNEITVRVNDLTTPQQTQLLGVEIGDVVKVTFTPSGIGPAIVKYAEVLRANHAVSVDGEHEIVFGLDTIDYTYFVLDDIVFGRLNEGNALGF